MANAPVSERQIRPTDDELARVAAWHKAEHARKAIEYRAAWKQAEEQNLATLRDMLANKRIVAVTASTVPVVLDPLTVQALKIQLDDGTIVAIDADRDSIDIELRQTLRGHDG